MDWPIRMQGQEAHRELRLCPREEGLSAGSCRALRDGINTATTNNGIDKLSSVPGVSMTVDPQNNPAL